MTNIYSAIFNNVVELIYVQTCMKQGIPKITLVGNTTDTAKEAPLRLRSAIENSGFYFPKKDILISLQPADVKKTSSIIDLAMAISIMQESDVINLDNDTISVIESQYDSDEKIFDVFDRYGKAVEKSIKVGKLLIIGALGIDGSIFGVNGVLPILLKAKEAGFDSVILPKDNVEEIDLPINIQIIAASNIKEIVDLFKSTKNDKMQYVEACSIDGGDSNVLTIIDAKTRLMYKVKYDNNTSDKDKRYYNIDGKDDIKFLDEDCCDELLEFEMLFDSVKGEEVAKRGLMIAIAGMHNFLMLGDSKKYDLISNITAILPKPTFDEKVEITSTYSLAKLKAPKLTPIRTISLNVSKTALVGSKSFGVGELKLANRGVLIVDDFIDINRPVLQVLNQELTNNTSIYPNREKTRFLLGILATLCACGNYGSNNRICTCQSNTLARYRRSFSLPIIDKLDVVIRMQSLDGECESVNTLSVKELKSKINLARHRQEMRFHMTQYNSNMSLNQIAKFCKLDTVTDKFFKDAINSLKLSFNEAISIQKIARTIADINDDDHIRVDYLAEAIQYAKKDFFDI